MRRRQIFAQAGVTTRPVAPEKTLEERYEERFGKPPHHRMKRETIEARLNDGDTRDNRA